MPVNEVLIVFRVYIKGRGETTPILVSIIKTKTNEGKKSSVPSHYIKILMCSKSDMCQLQFKSRQDWAAGTGILTLRQFDADGAWVLDLSTMSPHLSHCKTEISRT